MSKIRLDVIEDSFDLSQFVVTFGRPGRIEITVKDGEVVAYIYDGSTPDLDVIAYIYDGSTPDLDQEPLGMFVSGTGTSTSWSR